MKREWPCFRMTLIDVTITAILGGGSSSFDFPRKLPRPGLCFLFAILCWRGR